MSIINHLGRKIKIIIISLFFVFSPYLSGQDKSSPNKWKYFNYQLKAFASTQPFDNTIVNQEIDLASIDDNIRLEKEVTAFPFGFDLSMCFFEDLKKKSRNYLKLSGTSVDFNGNFFSIGIEREIKLGKFYYSTGLSFGRKQIRDIKLLAEGYPKNLFNFSAYFINPSISLSYSVFDKISKRKDYYLLHGARVYTFFDLLYPITQFWSDNQLDASNQISGFTFPVDQFYSAQFRIGIGFTANVEFRNFLQN